MISDNSSLPYNGFKYNRLLDIKWWQKNVFYEEKMCIFQVLFFNLSHWRWIWSYPRAPRSHHAFLGRILQGFISLIFQQSWHVVCTKPWFQKSTTLNIYYAILLNFNYKTSYLLTIRAWDYSLLSKRIFFVILKITMISATNPI